MSPPKRSTIFVSYASPDRQIAELVVSALEQTRQPCWIAPRNIEPGRVYADAIVEAIHRSNVFLVLLSTVSLDSPHVIREIERAVSRKLPILCVRLDGAIPSGGHEYLLSLSHWLDIGTSRADDFLPRIVSACERLLKEVRMPTASTRRTLSTVGHGLSPGLIDTVVPATVAVVPLKDLTAAADVQYLCDGFTEDLISRLTALRGIRVLSFTTLSLASSQHKDPIEMAARLDARWLLQGTVMGDSDCRRVQVRLSEVGSHLVLWSLSFDLDLSQLWESQWLIVNQIADKLGLQLASKYQSQPDRLGKRNPKSVDAYLRARFQTGRRDRKSLLNAFNLCTQALQADAQSAEILALLSEVYTLSANYGLQIIENPGVQALDMATRAVHIDEQLPESHIAMGLALRTSDFAKAAESYRRALSLHPANLVARHYLAHVLVNQGRYAEAEREERRALEIDPLYPISRAHLVRILVYTGQKRKAERQLANLEQDHLSPLLVHSTIGWILWCDRKWQDAIEHLQMALRIDPANLFCQEMHIDCLRRMHRFDEALKSVKADESLSAMSYVVLARISQVFSDLNRTSDARLFYEKAASQLESEAQNWLNNRSAVYYYNYALVQLLTGDATSAKTIIELAVDNGFLHYADLSMRPDWHDILGASYCSRLRKVVKARIGANTQFDFSPLEESPGDIR